MSCNPATLRRMARRLDTWPVDPRTSRRWLDATHAKRVFAAAKAKDETVTLSEVATKLNIDRSTLYRYLRESDDPPRPKEPGVRSRRIESAGASTAAAVEAWLNRYGRLPSKQDWAPEQIRRLGRRNAQERIAAWQEGWFDSHGHHRPFPRSSLIAFDAAIASVAAARNLAGGESEPHDAGRPSRLVP